jgi:peptide/nickel transport system ATP-binding protein
MLKALQVKKVFESGIFYKKKLLAVGGVDLEIGSARTIGLVGESGSGKTTLGRIMMMLTRPSSGSIFFHGTELTALNKGELSKIRKELQLIPQHPEIALDPRWKIFDSVAEPLRIHRLVQDRQEELAKVFELLEIVGLKEEHLGRYPHELSGGELQRVMIARVLSVSPKFIVADEPTSMLDVSVQAQILNLLMDLQKRFKVSYLFITHDLEVARRVSDQIAIMYAGQIVELAKTEDIFNNPLHPCTKHYLKATDLSGTQTAYNTLAINNTSREGCKYLSRCMLKEDCCLQIPPDLIDVGGEHRVRCHYLAAAG